MAKKAVKKDINYTLANGKISFTVSQTYRAPLKKVWEAATHARHLQAHFVDRVRGSFNEKFEPCFWYWKGHGEMPLYPVAYAKEKFVEFHWPLWGSKGKLSHVRFEFTEKNRIVTVKITETGWNQSGLAYAFDNCQGWTEFLMTLKAHVLWKKKLRTKR